MEYTNRLVLLLYFFYAVVGFWHIMISVSSTVAYCMLGKINARVTNEAIALLLLPYCYNNYGIVV